MNVYQAGKRCVSSPAMLKLTTMVSRFLTKNQPRIFMYHNFSALPMRSAVSADQFVWQIEHIKKHYNVMTFGELSEQVFEHKKIPNNAVVLTIDDGYKNFYDIAYPILREHKITASLYVTTDFIDGKDWLWFDKLKVIVHTCGSKLKGKTFKGLESPLTGCENADWATLNKLFLVLCETKKRKLIDEMGDSLNVDLSKPPEIFQPCSWQHLREMQKGGIEIGGHTSSHPVLTQLNEENSWSQISLSLQRITDELGPSRRTFCYPNGQPGDYNARIIQQVESAGYYNAAAAFFDGYNIQKRFLWRRLNGAKNGVDFILTLNGAEYLGARLKRVFIDD
ncbi:MAG: hypothetical protein CL600_00705 [Alteromonas sp.]|nr:hypothetical protein [Alteromonas sp.]